MRRSLTEKILTNPNILFHELPFLWKAYSPKKPFDRDRIKAFCNSWYKAISKSKPVDTSSTSTEANRLYESIIQKPEIERLACNPLLITLIANIHFKGQTLPDNRVQLYDIATETLLQYWVQNRVSDESQLKDKDDVIAILSPIAFNIL